MSSTQEAGGGGRRYGESGPWVIVLHGGPGAPGHMAPVARGLADDFRVIEPFQRLSGNESLTVDRHVADLHAVVSACCRGGRPALLGSSWGAMLALAFAAEQPSAAGPLVLVGCGTFDPVARARLRATLSARMDAGLKKRLGRLSLEVPDPDRRLKLTEELLRPLYSYELAEVEMETEIFDARGHLEAWEDMLRCQEQGRYPAAFAAISSPVLMLHGAADPHPGAMIRDSLAPYLPQLEYIEWKRCGHYPWLERATREEFFGVVKVWLMRHVS